MMEEAGAAEAVSAPVQVPEAAEAVHSAEVLPVVVPAADHHQEVVLVVKDSPAKRFSTNLVFHSHIIN
jgi:hypothetical protein